MKRVKNKACKIFPPKKQQYSVIIKQGMKWQEMRYKIVLFFEYYLYVRLCVFFSPLENIQENIKTKTLLKTRYKNIYAKSKEHDQLKTVFFSLNAD